MNEVATLSPVAVDVARLSAKRSERLDASVKAVRRAIAKVEASEARSILTVTLNMHAIGLEVADALESGDVKSVSAYAKYVAGFTTSALWTAYVTQVRTEAGDDAKSVNVPRGMTIDRAYRLSVALGARVVRGDSVEEVVEQYVTESRDTGPTAKGLVAWLTGRASDKPSTGNVSADESEDDGTGNEQVSAPFSPNAIADKLMGKYTVAQCEQIGTALAVAIAGAKGGLLLANAA